MMGHNIRFKGVIWKKKIFYPFLSLCSVIFSNILSFQGQCFVAINPNAFEDGFTNRMSELMSYCRNLEPVRECYFSGCFCSCFSVINVKSFVYYPKLLITARLMTPPPGRVVQSVGHRTCKSEVLGSIPGLTTYFRFSFR